MSFGPDVPGAYHGLREPNSPSPSSAPASDPLVWHPFPLASLPPFCRAIVEHGAASHGIDPAYFAVPLIGILGGCVGASRWIATKADYKQPGVLWASIVAPSGAGKSSPLSKLLHPLRRRD